MGRLTSASTLLTCTQLCNAFAANANELISHLPFACCDMTVPALDLAESILP
jgi:hypothetical protein